MTIRYIASNVFTYDIWIKDVGIDIVNESVMARVKFSRERDCGKEMIRGQDVKEFRRRSMRGNIKEIYVEISCNANVLIFFQT